MHAMEIFHIIPNCELSLFSMKLSELVGYFTTYEKLREFEINPIFEAAI